MFSVLMSVYARENPRALREALTSLLRQTLQPSEIVLVKDGPLTVELEREIEGFVGLLPLNLCSLPKNIGLASALNVGLRCAKQPWIMRFDSDDVCMPNRIEEQARIAMQGECQLFGCQAEEFEMDWQRPIRVRSVPLTHLAIVNYALTRNPFNHMTVCYRRDVVLRLGGYPNIPYMEDYALWIKMLADGVVAANSSSALVRARVGNGMIARRGGARYVNSEIQMQRLFVSLGLKASTVAFLDGFLRSSVFLSPIPLRSWAYSKLLRKHVST